MKIRETDADGMTYGAKNAKRMNHRPRTNRSARIARPSASSTSGMVVSTVNHRVCFSVRQNSESPSTSA